MEVLEKSLRLFLSSNGRSPFLEWLNKLPDRRAEQKIDARLNRLRLGNFGDCKTIGAGVFELRIIYGPGYRVYFGSFSSSIIILLIGGDKGTQDNDIEKAKKYWKEYKTCKNDADY